jgi:hypothetical protein
MFIYLAIIIYIILFPIQVHAYIDPGSGSFLVQAVGAVFLSIIVFFNNSLIAKIKELYRKLTKKDASLGKNEK